MTDARMPPLLSAEARRFLLMLAKWDPAEDGGHYELSADDVPVAAELLAAGQITLRDYKRRIEVEIAAAPTAP